MIVEWKSERIGHVGFSATAEDYDGVPRFSSYWLDATPKSRHGDRVALAAFLIYGGYMGGFTQLPQKFSPALESAFRRASGIETAFGPVEYHATGLPHGTRTLHVSWTGIETAEHITSAPSKTAFLHVDRSDKSSGSLRSIDSLRVASNAWVHCRTDLGTLQEIFPYLAAAVLYADDLEADTIQIRGNYDTASEDWVTLVHLLGACRLGIRCVP